MTRQRWNVASIVALLTLVLAATPALAQNGPGSGPGACPRLDGQGPLGPGYHGHGPQGTGQCGCCGLLDEYLAAQPIGALDRQERAAILRMREEEKLARDVYRALWATWNLPVFDHISFAEARHMDRMKMLIERYDLPDPVSDDSAGAFTDPNFAGLYEQLVAEGEASLVAALRVGATIEDRDLDDLAAVLEQTDNPDVRLVFQNLSKGSRNHLRAFASLLEANGETYTAQYLDRQQVAQILGSPHEHGVVYDEDGEVIATCHRRRGRGPRG